jgi:hypothetical protein
MCKEMPVIPVNKVVDLKRIIRKKWRAEEEERHKGSLTKKKQQPPNRRKAAQSSRPGCNRQLAAAFELFAELLSGDAHLSPVRHLLSGPDDEGRRHQGSVFHRCRNLQIFY